MEWSRGRTRLTPGSVYKPIALVAARYKITATSIAAPIGPNFDNELIPRVNC